MPVLRGVRGTGSDRAGRQPAERLALEEDRAAFPGNRPAGLIPRCANERCRSGWLHLLRSRAAPVFEGGWCCSPQCTRAQVEAALGRERAARPGGEESHRHRIPLGLAMLEQGWITAPELRRALEAQKIAGAGRLGCWLVQSRAASQPQVTRALAVQWSCPVLPLDFHDAEFLSPVLPRLFVDALGALPLRVAARRILYLGFEDRLDPVLAMALERMSGLHVECGVVEGERFRAAHARALEVRYPAVELVEASSAGDLARSLTRSIEAARPVESRLARVHDFLWLRMWLRPQAGVLPECGEVRDLVCALAPPASAPPDG